MGEKKEEKGEEEAWAKARWFRPVVLELLTISVRLKPRQKETNRCEAQSIQDHSRGKEAGWDPSPSRSRHRTVRQGPAKDRGLGTTAAEQSTLSSTDQTRDTEASICGKDCDLLPSHTWGKQLGEHQRGRAAPKVYLWSVCRENQTGKGRRSRLQR